MSNFINKEISVKAQLDNDQLLPQSLIWNETIYAVTAIGRQWTDEAGKHILVELQDASRMEIIYSRDFIWRLYRYWPPVLAA